MGSANVALALRVSKNHALPPISASAERNGRSVQVCIKSILPQVVKLDLH
jgi:hypothetical protein